MDSKLVMLLLSAWLVWLASVESRSPWAGHSSQPKATFKYLPVKSVMRCEKCLGCVWGDI